MTIQDKCTTMLVWQKATWPCQQNLESRLAGNIAFLDSKIRRT